MLIKMVEKREMLECIASMVSRIMSELDNDPGKWYQLTVIQPHRVSKANSVFIKADT
jgi:hypothetical protein